MVIPFPFRVNRDPLPGATVATEYPVSAAQATQEIRRFSMIIAKSPIPRGVTGSVIILSLGFNVGSEFHQNLNRLHVTSPRCHM